VPDIAGTIPAVRERPKVARRPTIKALAAPAKSPQSQAKTAAAVLEQRAVPEDQDATVDQANEFADLLLEAELDDQPEQLALFEFPEASEAQVEPTRRSPAQPTSPAVGTTMPEKKPLVKKKPAMLESGKAAATTIPDKKPTITKQAKEAAAAEARRIAALRWVPWSPIAVGIALASLAPQIHAWAAQWNPWGVRVVFPYVQLCALHEIGMSDELTRTMPQLMLYLQLPLEGLLVASNLRRGKGFLAAIGPIPGLHFVGALVLWIVAQGSMRPL
jgi:hypothetical protein